MTKEEKAAYDRQYRLDHLEELREKARQRYAANPDPAIERAARWAEKNPEKVNAATRKWKAANPDHMAALIAAWREAHPEKRREENHRRRVRIRGGIVEQFKDIEIFERDDYICQICFKPIDPSLTKRHPKMASLDHIVAVSNGGHHTRDNVQATHLVCNQRKNASDAHEGKI